MTDFTYNNSLTCSQFVDRVKEQLKQVSVNKSLSENLYSDMNSIMCLIFSDNGYLNLHIFSTTAFRKINIYIFIKILF